ncbi:MAG: tetratricopeptide repeat protein [Verrucomicrobiota bacterium]
MPKRIYFGFLLFLLSALPTLGFELEPVEFSWDNPDFQNSFIGTYGFNSDIEPRLSTADQAFLRNTILPLIETDPAVARERVNERLTQTSSPVLYFVQGNVLLQLGETEEAAFYLKRALSLFPSFRRAYRSLALLQLQEDNFQDSIPLWIKVIELGGGDGQSYGLLGYAYLQEENWIAAARALENALVFRPESRDIRRGIVHAFTQSGRPEQASELVIELLNENPEEPQLWRLLANLRLAEDDLSGTAAALEVSTRFPTKQPDSLLLLGTIYASLGLPQKALDAYERLLEVPKADLSFETAMKPLRTLMTQRLWDESLRYAALLRTSFGRDLDSDQSNLVNAAIVTASLYTNPSEEVAETAESYAEVFPLDGLLHLSLGEYFTNQENLGMAILFLRRAAATDEHQYEAKLRLANLFVSEERYEEAITTLRELQQIQFDSRVAAFLSRIENLENSERLTVGP